MRHKKPINLKLGKMNETLGFFGKARLIRRYDDRHEMVGGTAIERACARAWCQHFAPAIVFAEAPCEELVLTV